MSGGFAVRLVLVLCTTLGARAGTVWDGGGGNNRWNTANNWSPNGVPTFNSSTDLTFSGITRLTPDTNGNRTVNSITFSAGAGSFTLEGDNGPNSETLTFAGTGAGVTQLSGNDQTFTVNRVQWSASSVLNVSGAGDLIFGNGTSSASNFYGSGALTKTGTGGALVLNADNSHWSGGLTVSAGAVEARFSGSALGTGAVNVASGSTLRVATGGLTFANDLSLAGSLSVTASGSTSFTGGVAASGTATLDVATGAMLGVSGVVSGTADLSKTGAGTLMLSAAGGNSFAGDITVSAGTLSAGADGVFGTADVLLIAAGATVDLGGSAQTVNALAGAGLLDFGSAGSLTLGSGTSLFSGSFAGVGTIVIGAGATLQLGADFSASGLAIRLNGGTLNLNGHTATFAGLDIAASSVIDFGGTSSVAFDTIGFADNVAMLTVTGWTEDDAFETANFPGVTPDIAASGGVAQVAFDGFPSDHSAWSSYDQRVRPIPEPPGLGSVLIALGGLLWWKQHRKK